MSATNRGSKRSPSDYYVTPQKTIDTFLNNYEINKNGIILEPSAGNGAFIKALRRHGYTNKIIANEIHNKHFKALKDVGADVITHRNYLGKGMEKFKNEGITTVIGNPPFTYSKEFLEQSFKLFPNAEVIMLLRTALLESKKRKQFWQEHPLTKLFVLSERPSFTGKGVDATSYSFFIFCNKAQEIRVI